MKDSVKEYYSTNLESNNDLKTNACCTTDIPSYLKPLINNINDEVSNKFYGCGSPIPPLLKGMTVLDLGCGSGRDCFILSQLVGEKGKVIGVDMTEEQLNVAKNNLMFHMKQFNFKHPNIEFKQGEIENLKSLDIADNSIDIVISNCVINLSPNKTQVFKEIHRVLKPGGELYFSDIFSNRRIPEKHTKDKTLVGECLAGALYIEDFRRLLSEVGFNDYRVTNSSNVTINNQQVLEKLGMIKFDSLTIRSFKLDFEDICENYGHTAYYLGTIEQAAHEFILDNHHKFITGLPMPICGNTVKMLSNTRYKKHFNIIGNFSTHYGAFDCTPETLSNQKGCSTC